MIRCSACKTALGRGQCRDCWKERDAPTALDGKRARKPRIHDSLIRVIPDCVAQLTSSEFSMILDRPNLMKSPDARKIVPVALPSVPPCKRRRRLQSEELSCISEMLAENRLHLPLRIGTDVEIKMTSDGKGRGAFLLRDIQKNQLITGYDGHRVDPVTGACMMACDKITTAVSLLSADQKSAISKLRYSKKWALNVNCASSSRVAVDGTIAASTILDNVNNRGNIGFGPLLNSSVGTRIPPTCRIKWILKTERLTMCNYFFGNAEERNQPVFHAVRCRIDKNEIQFLNTLLGTRHESRGRVDLVLSDRRSS